MQIFTENLDVWLQIYLFFFIQFYKHPATCIFQTSRFQSVAKHLHWVAVRFYQSKHVSCITTQSLSDEQLGFLVPVKGCVSRTQQLPGTQWRNWTEALIWRELGEGKRSFEGSGLCVFWGSLCSIQVAKRLKATGSHLAAGGRCFKTLNGNQRCSSGSVMNQTMNTCCVVYAEEKDARMVCWSCFGCKSLKAAETMQVLSFGARQWMLFVWKCEIISKSFRSCFSVFFSLFFGRFHKLFWMKKSGMSLKRKSDSNLVKSYFVIGKSAAENFVCSQKAVQQGRNI